MVLHWISTSKRIGGCVGEQCIPTLSPTRVMPTRQIMRRQSSLLARNVVDFKPVPGLHVENWLD